MSEARVREERYEGGTDMNGKKLIVLVAGLGVLVVGWAAFRPERLWIDQKVSESLPVSEANASSMTPMLLTSGSFHSVAHETKGMAAIYETGGKRVLRLTNFETSNGPDVQIYLVAAVDATDNETVTKAGFVHVGALKGNIGDQNYELPMGLDLDKYKAVTIWCRRFGVNFGTAPLTNS
jgi:hypothetical protein